MGVGAERACAPLLRASRLAPERRYASCPVSSVPHRRRIHDRAVAAARAAGEWWRRFERSGRPPLAERGGHGRPAGVIPRSRCRSRRCEVIQQGQVFKLKARCADGEPLWAYRYRVAGGGSARLTLGEWVEEYLEAHPGERVTVAKLRWLLGKATADLGEVRLVELSPELVCAWRVTVPEIGRAHV